MEDELDELIKETPGLSLRKQQKKDAKKKKKVNQKQNEFSSEEQTTSPKHNGNAELQKVEPKQPRSNNSNAITLNTVAMLKQKGLDYVLKRHRLVCKHHSKYPHVIQLSYNQIESSMASSIVQECRGLILDTKADFRVVAYPYKKFFNYGEPNAVDIDWKSAVAFEKLDGSIITMYCYADAWHVSSSSLPEANGKITGMDKKGNDNTLAEVFWRVWKERKYSLPKDPNHCYMFELISKNNVIIVKYEEEDILLHGCRNLVSLQEVDPVKMAASNGWKCAPSIPIKSLEGLLEAAKALNPMKNEGYVVCDKFFNRLKVKAPAYVAVSLMYNTKDQHPKRRILQIIKLNEGDEFLSYFPQYAKEYHQLKQQYDELISKIEKEFEQAAKKFEDNKKQFSTYCLNHKYGALLKEMYKDMYSSKQVQSRSVRQLLKELSEKEIEAFLPQAPENNYNNNNTQPAEVPVWKAELIATINENITNVIQDLIGSDNTQHLEAKAHILIAKLQKVLAGYWEEIEMQPFGSIASGIGMLNSDLDICLSKLVKPLPAATPIHALERKMNTAGEEVWYWHHLPELLKQNDWQKVAEFPTARYPIVTFYDPEIDLSCDISFGNHIGVNKAVFIKTLCEKEPRLKPIILVVKFWAKRRQINNSSAYTMNSFVLVLMVIYVFQKYGVLNKLEPNSEEEANMCPTYSLDSVALNSELTCAELLLLFFRYFSQEFDYTNQSISVRLGQVVHKEQTMMHKTGTPMIFAVEDPFIIIENCARTVANHSLEDIRAEFNRGYQTLLLNGSVVDLCKPPQHLKKERKKWALPPIPYYPYANQQPNK